MRKQDVLAFIENGDGGDGPSRRCTSERPSTGPTRRRRRRPGQQFDRAAELPAAPPPAPVAMPAGGTAPLSRMRAFDRRAHAALAAHRGDLHHDRRGRPQAAIEAARKHTGLTYLPYIARATIETLAEFPALNATLEDGQLTTYDGVHMGIAVSMGEGGLADRPGHPRRPGPLRRRPRQAHQGHRPARTRRRADPDEVRGGSFTITNPGGYGWNSIATPVINQPQVGDPRHRGRGQAARGHHRRARQRLDRHPPR